MEKIDLSLVMPCYNEAKQIEGAVRNYISGLDGLNIKYEIILVNDGSKDNTLELMQKLSKKYKNVRYVDLPVNCGYGIAVRSGLSKAKGKILGWIDGDGQFGVSSLVEAYNKLANGEFDFCKGRRISRGDGSIRYVASFGYSALFNIIFLNRIVDVCSKPKLMTRNCYNSIQLFSRHWFVDSEVLIKIKRGNFKMGDVDVVFDAKMGRKSSVGFMTVVEYVINLLRMRFGGFG